jgi:MraZ protein
LKIKVGEGVEKWYKMFNFAAENNNDTTMSYPVGHFNCKLDAKGRLMLPAEFKEQMGEQAEEGFVMRPTLFEHSVCLDLFTRRDWDEQQEKLKGFFSIYNEEDNAALHFLNDGVRFAKLDASGRLQIPKELMERGGLEKEVVVAALANKMEIWDKDRYAQSIATVDKKKILEILKNIK